MKWGRWLISAAVLLLVVYAASRVDWPSAGATLRKAALLPLVAAIVINVASVILHGVRWWLFLRRVGSASLAVAVRGSVVGAGFNNLLIASGGEATRALLVARTSGTPLARVIATLVLDRLFDPICYALLLFGATWLIPLPHQLAAARPIVGLTLVVAAGLSAFLILTRSREPDDSARRAGWRAEFREFRDGLRTLSTPGRFAIALLVSIAIWVMQIATFDLVARSVGIALPLAGSIAALLLTNTGLVLRATPGNVGFFQFTYAVAVARFGIPTEAAVASALLLQLVQIVPVTVLALALAPRLLRKGD